MRKDDRSLNTTNSTKHSAIKKIITGIITAEKHETIEILLKRIKNDIGKLQTIDYIYIIGKNRELIGVVSIKILFRHKKETKLERIMQTKLVTVAPETNMEKVADLAVKHNLKAVPVTENKRLIGVVPMEEILPVLNWALKEDVLHLIGIHKAHLKYENTMAVPLFLGILHRLPWLLVGLIGIILSAIFISAFEEQLGNYIILAFFIPAILYMSNALGTQHQTLLIRDLAIFGNELKLKSYFFKQMLISLILALIIASVLFIAIALFWNEAYVAFVISFSMAITLIITSLSAFLITLMISKLKLDPALGSGPFATIISDMSSVFVYFLIASAFL